MTALVGLLLGAAIGCAVWLVVVAFTPVPRRLETVLEELHAPPRQEQAPAAVSSWWRRLALRAASWSPGDRRQIEQQLAMCGETWEQHAVVKLGFAAGGAFVPVLLWAIWSLGHVPVGSGVIVPASVVFAVVGWMLPDRTIGARAEAAQRQFRHTVAAFLDLTVVALASGDSMTTALRRAAAAGNTAGFVALRTALDVARWRGQRASDALAELAERMGSTDLADLAKGVDLAFDQGVS